MTILSSLFMHCHRKASNSFRDVGTIYMCRRWDLITYSTAHSFATHLIPPESPPCVSRLYAQDNRPYLPLVWMLQFTLLLLTIMTITRPSIPMIRLRTTQQNQTTLCKSLRNPSRQHTLRSRKSIIITVGGRRNGSTPTLGPMSSQKCDLPPLRQRTSGSSFVLLSSEKFRMMLGYLRTSESSSRVLICCKSVKRSLAKWLPSHGMPSLLTYDISLFYPPKEYILKSTDLV